MALDTDYLFGLHREISCPVERGVLPVTKQALGAGFFPGCRGYYGHPGQNDLMHMWIGHNFDSEKGYKETLLRGREDMDGKTWSGILARQKEVGLQPENGYYTNLFMGIIKGDISTGKFPGAGVRVFRDKCLELLLIQINLIRPKLIVAMGAEVPRRLALMSPELKVPWRYRSLNRIDESAASCLCGISFYGIPDWKTIVVALTHPCLYDANVWRREYRVVPKSFPDEPPVAQGHAAMLSIFRKAVKLSGLGK